MMLYVFILLIFYVAAVYNVSIRTSCEQDWYYERFSAECKQIPDGACNGIKITFHSRWECEMYFDRERVCQPISYEDGVQCMAYIKLWTYDTANEECRTFIYGNCGGSENMFDSEAVCNRKCKDALPSVSMSEDTDMNNILLPISFSYDTSSLAKGMIEYNSPSYATYPVVGSDQHFLPKPDVNNLHQNSINPFLPNNLHAYSDLYTQVHESSNELINEIPQEINDHHFLTRPISIVPTPWGQQYVPHVIHSIELDGLNVEKIPIISNIDTDLPTVVSNFYNPIINKQGIKIVAQNVFLNTRQNVVNKPPNFYSAVSYGGFAVQSSDNNRYPVHLNNPVVNSVLANNTLPKPMTPKKKENLVLPDNRLNMSDTQPGTYESSPHRAIANGPVYSTLVQSSVSNATVSAKDSNVIKSNEQLNPLSTLTGLLLSNISKHVDDLNKHIARNVSKLVTAPQEKTDTLQAVKVEIVAPKSTAFADKSRMGNGFIQKVVKG